MNTITHAQHTYTNTHTVCGNTNLLQPLFPTPPSRAAELCPWGHSTWYLQLMLCPPPTAAAAGGGGAQRKSGGGAASGYSGLVMILGAPGASFE